MAERKMGLGYDLLPKIDGHCDIIIEVLEQEGEGEVTKRGEIVTSVQEMFNVVIQTAMAWAAAATMENFAVHLNENVNAEQNLKVRKAVAIDLLARMAQMYDTEETGDEVS